MRRYGWTLLFHHCVLGQLQRLHAAAERARQNDPEGFELNANVKLLRALSQLMLETVPTDPARDEYRLGNTLGPAHRHWRRAKIGRRFRLFFRYDYKAKVIVYARVNDETMLRSSGGKSDPYAAFEKMLGRGNPPDD
ncbi:MAG: type II toxin-antitoxin system YhaV family toxin [Burkholderiaceae bacterium]